MEILALSILVGAFIKFLYYCIGSPMANESNNGRIFSIWGRFVSSQYTKYHNKESIRIWNKFNDNPFEGTDEEIESRVEGWRRPNPWNAAGACSICFGTWVSMVSWFVLIPTLGLNPVLWIFAVAGSVVTSKYIDF